MKLERSKVPLKVERLDTGGLKRLDAAEWDSLSNDALVENPFYSREVMRAALGTIDRDVPLEALAIRGPGHELLGLFPYRLRYLPFKTADGACNRYQPSCTPLIRRDLAHSVISAWLGAMRGGHGVPRFWRLKHIDLGSRLNAILDQALPAHGMDRVAVNPYTRPHLTRLEGGLETHLEQVLPRRRLKDIERNIRRLSELGALRFERARAPDLVARRLEQFLKLENSGWKGETGTAFLANEKDAAFARTAYAPREDGKGLVTIDSLLLDDTPIAISLNLQARETAFTPKGAYDERYRRYCPGLVLEYFVIKAFYEDGTTVDMDAATTQEGHVLSNLWNRSKEMSTLILGPADWRLYLTAQVDQHSHASRERAKSLFNRAPLRSLGHRRQANVWLKSCKGFPWAVAVAALGAE